MLKNGDILRWGEHFRAKGKILIVDGMINLHDNAGQTFWQGEDENKLLRIIGIHGVLINGQLIEVKYNVPH